ncbi:MAG: UDP-N-acetylmuramate dehydrogenase [Clostridia bacterium]|nr:UDP-N-acetylmuramate dehydrogenase [Clostridia bacterium]
MLAPILDKEMKNYSSMKTGGMAKCAYFPENETELCEIIKSLKSENKKYIVLGNMSNVLLPDEKIEVPIVVTTEMKSVKVSDETAVYAEAGVSFTKLALDMCKRGLSGLEFAYGIPGTVGGAVYMNAGAYGGEAKDVIKNVRVLKKDGSVVTLSSEECEFSYRKSIFHNDEYVILGAEFELVKKDADECVNAARELMQKRVDKQPLEYPSCGSTFKRPEGYFAGALIVEAGLKGYSVGGAQVSQKHAGFVINRENATTADVLSLMRHIRKTIFEKNNVTLEAEIKLLGTDGEFFLL